jgi:protein O-GlcNAc transferase
MTAEQEYAEGLQRLELSRGADSSREYRDDLETALSSFEAAVRADPNHPGAQRQRAYCLAQLDRHAEAAEAWAAAVRLEPADAALFLGLGQALAKLERPGEALDAFDASLKLSETPDALEGRAAALTALGSDDDEAAWKRVAEVPGGFAEEWRRARARAAHAASLARQHRPEALDAFREAFERDGNELTGGFRGQGLQQALKEHDVAQAALRLWAQAHAGEPRTWWAAGNAWLVAGELDEAIAAYEQLVRMQPDDPQAWFRKGEAHLAAGQPAAAEAAYQRALALWPEFTVVKDRLKTLAAGRRSS